MGETVQIALPVVALVVLVNMVLTIQNRRTLSNGGVSSLIFETRNGQKACHSALADIKTAHAVQTEVLKDIRDTLKEVSSRLR